MKSYYPDGATKSLHNTLQIGGYDTVELAERFGTPLYVLDELTIRNTAREFVNALKEHYPNSLPIYAAKALSIQAIFRMVQQEGFGLDVVSAGELYTAKSIEFPGQKIYLHGNNKSREELVMAIEYGCKIIVDNFNELRILQELGQAAQILLRITPGIECHTHDYIKTGHINSKFGFDRSQLPKALNILKDISKVEFLGLHCHIGSQIFATNSYEDAAAIMVSEMTRLRDEFNITVSELNLGGGYGISYTEADDPPAIYDAIAKKTEAFKTCLKQQNLSEPLLIIEPGRSLVGRAGVTLYTLGASKHSPSGKAYFAVDGGMADNPRHITYGSAYSAAVANKINDYSSASYTIAGRFCESGDVLIENLKLPESTKAGDLLAVFGTGAYNYSMSSNYNRVPRPAMVLVQNGEAEVILRRETLEDLLHNDVLPSRLLMER